MFYGLGADGTVGANKNSIKIIGEETDNYAQGYFVYDSKKAGAITVSHLRFGPQPDPRALPDPPGELRRLPPVRASSSSTTCSRTPRPAATFLLNAPYGPDEVWDQLPREVQEQIIDKKLKFYVIDAYEVADETGHGRAHQHDHADLLLRDLRRPAARARRSQQIKHAIEKTYGKQGRRGRRAELRGRRRARSAHLHEVDVPAAVTGNAELPPIGVRPTRPSSCKRVTAAIIAGKGDLLPVSAFPVDGTCPTGTTQWEKRNIALEIPVWDPALCIQCNKCSLVCPHAAIRAKVYDPAALAQAPADLQVDRLQGHASSRA